MLRYENWVLKSRPCFSAHKSQFSRSHSKNRTFSSLSFLIYVSQEGYSMLGTSYLPIRVLLTRPAKKSVFVLKLNCCQNITSAKMQYCWFGWLFLFFARHSRAPLLTTMFFCSRNVEPPRAVMLTEQLLPHSVETIYQQKPKHAKYL